LIRINAHFALNRASNQFQCKISMRVSFPFSIGICISQTCLGQLA
jgi:hypothetical protein